MANIGGLFVPHRSWASRAAVLIGLVALLLSVLDAYELIVVARRVIGRPSYIYRSILAPAYCINGLLLLFVFVAGVLLVLRNRYAIQVALGTFIAETAYFATFMIATSLIKSPLADLWAGLFGSAMAGLSLQFITFFPLWGAILLWVVRRSVRPASVKSAARG